MSGSSKKHKSTNDSQSNKKNKLIEDVARALANPEITGQNLFLLAEKCFLHGLFDEHDKVIARAALEKNDLRAIFIYVCKELEKAEPNIEFLKQHCDKPDANPCCLTLLAQLMETNDFGLDFDIDLAANLISRAISRANALVLADDLANQPHWQMAGVRAAYEKIRYILDFKVEANPQQQHAQWQIAEHKFQFFPTDDQLLTVGATKEDMLDIKTLRARVFDAAGDKENALKFFRLAKQLAKETGSSVSFIDARIATLTPDEKEAKRLLPPAIKWLDDRGVGASDKEMPDLVLRYNRMLEANIYTPSVKLAEFSSRAAKLLGKRVEKPIEETIQPPAATPQLSSTLPASTQLLSNSTIDNVPLLSVKKSYGGLTDDDWSSLSPLLPSLSFSAFVNRSPTASLLKNSDSNVLAPTMQQPISIPASSIVGSSSASAVPMFTLSSALLFGEPKF